MLAIFVSPRKRHIETADQKKMRVYPLLVKENGAFRNLAAKTDFSGISTIELVIVRWYLPFFWKVTLTPELKKGIIVFLQEYHAQCIERFNCYSFACLASGIEQKSRAVFWKCFWEAKPKSQKRKVGDVVIFENIKLNLFRHAAVYIGFGLYLAVFGAGGTLVVATLKDMQRDYEACDLSFVTPR